MKLVIEVTETLYEACKEWQEANVSNWSENVIAKGTPYEEENTCDEREKGNCPFYTAR